MTFLRGGALLGALLGAVQLCTPRAAEAAQTYDPEVRYQTLTTPNFLVMFPVGYEHIALRAGTIAERTLPYIVERYQWKPAQRTSIIINDQTDSANGSATIVPSKVVTIYVTAPTELSGLEDYDDWLSTVITHELTHIVHLDMVYGLPWLGRLVFGKYVSLNQYTPAWVTEGLAVYEETVTSGSGRGRSSYVDMVLRCAALEDRFPTIDRGYREYPNWPFGHVPYFLGGRFQLWLAERYGEEKLLEYHRSYATDPIPYLTWVSSAIAFDASLESLWSTFAEEAREDAELTVDAIRTSTIGLTVPQRLTKYGGDLSGPRITPDGQHIIFSTTSPVDGPRIRRIRIDGTDDQPLVDDTFSKAISFTPDGKAFYFQQANINQRFYFHNSLLRYDLRQDSTDQVEVDTDEALDFLAPSGSLRARDPDISPDGKQIVFVQAPYGSNRLVLAWLESDGITIHPRVIVKAEPDVELSDPRFSPDGKLIAVSRFERGRRDIVLFDREGTVVEEVTRDRALDLDPTWTPDGQWLVFASDRTGIYNLYAYHLERRELRQLTNLIGGAYQPSISPDGGTVVYRGYSADGFDVYLLKFEPDKGAVVALHKDTARGLDTSARRWPPRRAGLPEIPPPAPFTGTPLPAKLPDGWSIGDYSSLDTILPFHDNWNLYPAAYANQREIIGSLTHFGRDAMETQHYALQLTYGTSTKFLGGGAAYFNDQFEPTFGLSGAATARTISQSVFVDRSPNCPFGLSRGRRFCYGSPNGDYNERRLLGAFSIGLPFLRRHFFSLSYIFERRDALDPLPAGTHPEFLPPGGRYARVQLGYTYGNVRRFPYSISLERGTELSVALQALSRGLGGDYEEFVLTTEGRWFLTMPWTARGLTNHVLASRLALGVSGGPNLAETFQLGGVTGISILTTTTENFYGLRGIDVGALRGTGVISGSLEYRAPLLRIDHGVGTVPLTLNVLHAALFADFGRVFERLNLDAVKQDFFGGFAIGAGAELRADVTIAYDLPLSLIAGYAMAVRTPSGAGDVASNRPYFKFGTTF